MVGGVCVCVCVGGGGGVVQEAGGDSLLGGATCRG